MWLIGIPVFAGAMVALHLLNNGEPFWFAVMGFLNTTLVLLLILSIPAGGSDES